MAAQDDTAPMVERDEAAAQLIDKAEDGAPDAQYLVGKLYQDGPVVIPDSVEARCWFGLSARQGHVAERFNLIIYRYFKRYLPSVREKSQ